MLNKTYVVFDLETVCTGPDDKELLEIGAVKLKNEKITDRILKSSAETRYLWAMT